MSHESLPISPERFAQAIKDLSISSLHLKAAELRNSIAHLDYSNEQLKPFAEGTAAAPGSAEGVPDQDCIDAIKENEVVIARMQERIELLKAEVENRGGSWTEFLSAEEVAGNGIADAETPGEDVNDDAAHPGNQEEHEAWRDGTFQTGTISNGEVRLNGASQANGTGGRVSDDELRRQIEERIRALSGEEGDEGMHL
ncbi:hypothetical protein F5884DRAFT_367133 [Xylogone sp. PMI_703]|nr:hypothetical protein F5884DRAFT_367133 [Xylogone sp. PMI_703]